MCNVKVDSGLARYSCAIAVLHCPHPALHVCIGHMYICIRHVHAFLGTPAQLSILYFFGGGGLHEQVPA